MSNPLHLLLCNLRDNGGLGGVRSELHLAMRDGNVNPEYLAALRHLYVGAALAESCVGLSSEGREALCAFFLKRPQVLLDEFVRAREVPGQVRIACYDGSQLIVPIVLEDEVATFNAQWAPVPPGSSAVCGDCGRLARWWSRSTPGDYWCGDCEVG